MKPVCSVLIAGPERGWASELAGELGPQDVEVILCRDPEEVVSGHRFDIAFQTVGTRGGIRPRQDV